MKIDTPSKPLPGNPIGDAAARTTGKDKSGQPSVAQQAAPQHSSSVSLGSTATQLRSMEGGASTTPAVNAAKVAEIKQAISEGRFQVNSAMVADRLIASVRDLINGKA